MATTRTRSATEEKNMAQKQNVGEMGKQKSVGAQARSAAQETAAAAQERVQSLASRAKDEARTYFHGKQEAMADTVDGVSEAARQVAQSLRERDQAMVAQYAETAADQVHALSRYLRDLEPDKLVKELEAVARRQPALVFGGLFVAGLAISRFLRATERSGDFYEADEFQGTGVGSTSNQGYSARVSTGRRPRRR